MMTSSYLTNPLVFIIDTLFYLYMIVVALRLIMQWANWDYTNPVVQTVIRLTQPPIKQLRRIIPAWRHIDTATIVFLILIATTKLLLIGLIAGGLPKGFYWFSLIVAELVSLFIGLFTVTIIVEVILSWVTPPGHYNPISPLVKRMNAPLLDPVRRHLPLLGGIDLSPLFVLLGLQVLLMLLIPPLTGQI
jgi:YggT family protein